MKSGFIASDIQMLKINCYDLRGHQNFLQLSSEMSRYKDYLNDSSWWLEREKECLGIFRQYGYDLQSGIWYCLIACQRNGWKGIANASMLLASGFIRRQTPCWPPLAAHDLRRQLLDSYSKQLLPLTLNNAPTLLRLLTAADLLQNHAVELQSGQLAALRKFSAWLKTHINASKHPPVARVHKWEPTEITEENGSSSPVRQSGKRLLWMGGAALTLMIGVIINWWDNPNILRLTGQIWPENPLIERYLHRLEVQSRMFTPSDAHQRLKEQLATLETRLLDAEQKRKPYITISELKTAVYQMQETLRQQAQSAENQLWIILHRQKTGDQVTKEDVYHLTQRIKVLESHLQLLTAQELLGVQPNDIHTDTD